MDTMLAMSFLILIRIVLPFGLLLLLGTYLEWRGLTGNRIG
jgi:hypothetical protein